MPIATPMYEMDEHYYNTRMLRSPDEDSELFDLYENDDGGCHPQFKMWDTLGIHDRHESSIN